MIGWLKGKILNNWRLSSKKGVVINVGGIGYEVQLLSKQMERIDNSTEKEFWIHQINREDHTNLYGFKELNQRDLFRKIISVNGIGPQIGMALLDDLEVNQLVDAIEDNDLSLLTKSQGIGIRIAERLVIDLKNKLQQFKNENEITIDIPNKNKSIHFANYLGEIESILSSLGYIENEIKDSVNFIRANEKENTLLINSLSEEARTELMDKHIKEILIKLSQQST